MQPSPFGWYLCLKQTAYLYIDSSFSAGESALNSTMVMKKILILPLLCLLSLSVFSQKGWEGGVYGGVHFARLHSLALDLKPTGTDINGFTIGGKGAWSFHKNLAVEMSLGLTKRENQSLWRYFNAPSILGGIAPIYDSQTQFDLEHQTRIRYKMLADFPVQPWIATGVAQFIQVGHLNEPDRNLSDDIYGGVEPNFKAYEIAMAYSAGVRFKVMPTINVDIEGNLRHFVFGESEYTRHLMGGGNIGIVYTPRI